MNSRKKLNIKDYLKKRNVKRFSLFILIAFVFLIFSKLSNSYKQTIKLKVAITNIEDEVILENDSLNVMDAFIEAKGFTLVPFLFKNYKTIDLDAQTDLVNKSNHYVFDVQKHKYLIEEQLGSSYKMLSIKPDSLIVSYSKRASKYVPIDLNTAISFTSGFDIKGDYVLSIDSVKVVGSVKRIAEISAVTTEALILQEVNKNIEAEIYITGIQDIETFPKSIEVRAEVKRFTEGKIEVPITLVNKPANTIINFFPKTVTISYYVDLDNYSEIKTSDFIIECDYNSIKDNQTYFIPKIIKKPEFAKRVSMKQKRVDFIKL
ncbi:hypothetical protein [Winogradskyella sp. PE311]|uniref:hypothetical protein n=1 Tax=Winogradskyella sp. PE311 TaxID=3366943 RepID=UPI00398152FF